MEKYIKKMHSITNVDEGFIEKLFINLCDVSGLSIEDGVAILDGKQTLDVEDRMLSLMDTIIRYTINDDEVCQYLIELESVSGFKLYELVIMFFNWLDATNLNKEDGLKELNKHSDSFVINRLAKHATNGEGLKIWKMK